MTPSRRTELLLFSAAFLAYAWFHQGGGWSQNGRFAMVRAIVEEGRYALDGRMIYRPGERPGILTTVPVTDGTFAYGPTAFALSWDAKTPIGRPPDPGGELVPVGSVSVSGDLAYGRGHFHPNKAPGAALAAVPAYLVVHTASRVAGVELDTPRALAVSAWLTGALSVGLLAAIGVVVFHRLALEYASGNAGSALLATAAFAFGTMYFPYATMLFEHDVVAAALLIAFYAIKRTASSGARWAALAGFCAGWAAITNYVTAAVVVILAAYLVTTVKHPRAWGAFAAGVLVPFLVICSYNLAAFGTPFTTNYSSQNAMFLRSQDWLGVFVPPSFGVLAAVTFSPFRGLFVSSPVLLAAIFGLVRMFRRFRADAVLCAAIAGFYLVFTMSFNAWEGGNGVGPRYLVPALPFLCLALPLAIERIPRFVTGAAAVSIAINLLVTAVDPQAPVAGTPGRALWKQSPLTDYILPLFVTGTAHPLVDRVIDSTVAQRGALSPEERETLRRELREQAQGGGLPIALVRGPVSANPIGMYEGWFFTLFPAGSPEARGNSFNLGELAFPESRWSLLPLALVAGALLWKARD